jgi:polysaccharide pyruvyl transferase CsaB
LKKKSVTIAIVGAYGQGNMGDETILSEILRNLRISASSMSNHLRLRFIVFSYNKEKTVNLLQMRWLKVIELPRSYLSVRRILHILRTISTIDLLIIGGGSVIYDAIILPLSCLILFSKILNKKVMCYAIGMSHVRGKMGRLLAWLTLNMVDLITVRDTDARKYLTWLHVIKPPIVVTADPVITAKAETPAKIDQILSYGSIKKGETPWIGISVRSWFGMADKPIMFERIKVIIQEIVRYLAEQLDANVVFIPLSFDGSIDDRETAHELIEAVDIKDKSRIKVLAEEFSPEEIIEILGQMDMVIGMRLHSLIFASTQGVPIVAINYDPKIKGFMKMINQQDKVIEYYDSTEKALEIVRKVWMNRQIIKDELKIRTSILRRKAVINARLALDLLR